MTTFGILGSGFGLYGYLPALVELGFDVILPGRYRSKIQSRHDLVDFANRVEFVDEMSIPSISDYLVIARDPRSQYKQIRSLEKSNIRLFLEKPLAPTLEDHKSTIKHLMDTDFKFSVGYLFPYTLWWKMLEDSLLATPTEKFKIKWELPQPSNWKNNPAAGGGSALFYGIHFVPLLKMPSLQLRLSKNVITPKSQELDFTNPFGGGVTANIIFESHHRFTLSEATFAERDHLLFESLTPFGALTNSDVSDPRIPYLKQYISATLSDSGPILDFLSLEEAVIDYRSTI